MTCKSHDRNKIAVYLRWLALRRRLRYTFASTRLPNHATRRRLQEPRALLGVLHVHSPGHRSGCRPACGMVSHGDDPPRSGKRGGEQLVRLEILKELLRRKLDAHNALRARLHELASALTAYVGINNFAASRQQDEAAEQHKATQIAELTSASPPCAKPRSPMPCTSPWPSRPPRSAFWANYIARIEQSPAPPSSTSSLLHSQAPRPRAGARCGDSADRRKRATRRC